MSWPNEGSLRLRNLLTRFHSIRLTLTLASTMQHRALLVPDILLVIFEHVNHEKISRWSRKSLAALASTCKAFHEPAMDLLWANMDGIEPLLGCVTRLHPMIYGGDKKVSMDDLYNVRYIQFFHDIAYCHGRA